MYNKSEIKSIKYKRNESAKFICTKNDICLLEICHHLKMIQTLFCAFILHEQNENESEFD